MNMLDVFKSILQNGMEIEKVKEHNENYKFVLSYKGMTAKCQLPKVCALGYERNVCKNVINNAISGMYINANNLIEAKKWLDGEKWNNEKNINNNPVITLKQFLSMCSDISFDYVVNYNWNGNEDVREYQKYKECNSDYLPDEKFEEKTVLDFWINDNGILEIGIDYYE